MLTVDKQFGAVAIFKHSKLSGLKVIGQQVTYISRRLVSSLVVF